MERIHDDAPKARPLPWAEPCSTRARDATVEMGCRRLSYGVTTRPGAESKPRSVWQALQSPFICGVRI